MVYYLEAPYGHLMLEQMEGTQARTTARGNLFSFELPWEDVSARCKEAETAWYAAATIRNYMVARGSTRAAEHTYGLYVI